MGAGRIVGPMLFDAQYGQWPQLIGDLWSVVSRLAHAVATSIMASAGDSLSVLRCASQRGQIDRRHTLEFA